MGSFATLVELFTRTFLLEENLHPRHQGLLKAVKDHEATFTSLKNSRNEAKSEWWDPQMQGASSSHDALVDSLTRLAQHVSGLRSGLNLQRELAIQFGGITRMSMPSAREDMEIQAIERIFGELVEELAPPLDALAVCTRLSNLRIDTHLGIHPQETCVRTLNKIRKVLIRSFTRSDVDPSCSLEPLIADIRRALFTFERTSSQSLARLLKRDREELGNSADISQLPNDDTETLCLVYL